MTRTESEWKDAADDTNTYFNERKRSFDAKHMLLVIDDLAMRGAATQAELVEKHGTPDFIATTLGHVTTAIHGKGSVPAQDGWYSATDNPRTYRINPLFASAWKLKRRLPRSAALGE